MLQRLSEDLEYYELLDKAAKCHSSLEQMCYVAAFTVSSYSTTVHRTGKPFNPLLGETFELDRHRECGYRSLCEQVVKKKTKKHCKTQQWSTLHCFFKNYSHFDSGFTCFHCKHALFAHVVFCPSHVCFLNALKAII